MKIINECSQYLQWSRKSGRLLQGRPEERPRLGLKRPRKQRRDREKERLKLSCTLKDQSAENSALTCVGCCCCSVPRSSGVVIPIMRPRTPRLAHSFMRGCEEGGEEDMCCCCCCCCCWAFSLLLLFLSLPFRLDFCGEVCKISKIRSFCSSRGASSAPQRRNRSATRSIVLTSKLLAASRIRESLSGFLRKICCFKTEYGDSGLAGSPCQIKR